MNIFVLIFDFIFIELLLLVYLSWYYGGFGEINILDLMDIIILLLIRNTVT